MKKEKALSALLPKGITRRDFMKTMAVISAAAGTTGLLQSCGSSSSSASADVIYRNGKIITIDPLESIAQAVAVKDGRILRVGTNSDVNTLAGPSTKVIDLQGKTVVPGFVDAHTHPMETAMMIDSWVDCRYPGTPSVVQALKNIQLWIKNRAVPKGEWVFAVGVSASQNKYIEKRLPTKAELDTAAPDNPIAFANGAHMAVVNSVAISALGITRGMTKLPHGGAVQLDENGDPTGVLTDAMSDIPSTPKLADLQRYYTKIIQETWNQHGFTSLMAITPSASLPVLQAVSKRVKPTIRYNVSVWTSSNGAEMPEDVSAFAMPKEADPQWYEFVGIKVWVDGENDARTGWMYEPYIGSFPTDPPGNRGSLVTTQSESNRFAMIGGRAGVMPMLHVAGDAAMDIGLNALDELIKSGQRKNLIRLEHYGVFQMMPSQLQRAKDMKRHGLCISVQPTWMLELVKANYENMGAPRTETGFLFRTMIDAGLEPAAGTDVTGVYLENLNPFLGIYASVTRDSDNGVFLPKEAVTATEALKMWTIWPARSLGKDSVIGSIEQGKYADMVVLSEDVLTIDPKKLKEVQVLKTIVGGNVVYEAK